MITAKSANLPSLSTLRRVDVEGIVRAHDLEWEYAKEVEISRSEFDRLVKAWKAFRGPVRDPEHFMVCVAIAPGDLYACAEYERGQIDIQILEEDELDPQLLPAVEAVSMARGEKRIGPNDRCYCGSGKKFKRCCGRNG